MQKVIFYYWKNSKIRKVPSSLPSSSSSLILLSAAASFFLPSWGGGLGLAAVHLLAGLVKKDLFLLVGQDTTRLSRSGLKTSVDLLCPAAFSVSAVHTRQVVHFAYVLANKQRAICIVMLDFSSLVLRSKFCKSGTQQRSFGNAPFVLELLVFLVVIN